MKHYFILGAGATGEAAARYLLAKGEKVTLVDAKAQSLDRCASLANELGSGLELILESDRPACLQALKAADVFLPSPGIAPTHFLSLEASTLGKARISEVELACQELSGIEKVALTGSNGKTTTALMAEYALKAAGVKAQAVGNIGVPVSNLAYQSLQGTLDVEFLIFELSSFQLEQMSETLFNKVLVSNISPNHLDRYDGMDAYVAAKMRIEGLVKEGGELWTHSSVNLNWQRPCLHFSEKETVDLCFKSQKEKDLLEGFVEHDQANALAAFALCRDQLSQQGVDFRAYCQSLKTFKKPKYRLEEIASIAGVRYINDSKSTSVAALRQAVLSVGQSIRLIAGGKHKGESYSGLISEFTGRVVSIYAIGEAKDLIKNELGVNIPVRTCNSLEEAFFLAKKEAKSGEKVLFSPGCSSYDMFLNFEERGRCFEHLINNKE